MKRGCKMNQNSDTIFGFPKYPTFVPNAPRFPTETFLGRYLHYLDVIDPRTLVASEVSLGTMKMIVIPGTGSCMARLTNFLDRESLTAKV